MADKKLNASEEQKHAEQLEAVTGSGKEVVEAVTGGTKELTNSIHELLMATLVSKDPKIAEVAKKLVVLVDEINKATSNIKDTNFKPLADGLKALESTLADIPSQIEEAHKANNFDEKLADIAAKIGNQKFDPKITVTAPKVDLSPVTKLITGVENALKDFKVDIPETNLDSLQEEMRGVKNAINGLSFPVPNYVLPFKDPAGNATQVELDDNGSIPINANSTDNTSSGTISTQNLSPTGTATTNSAVEITLGEGQTTIAIQTVGTYTGALTLQGTVDGSTWVSFGGTPILNANTGLWLATITSALQSVFFAKVSGFAKVRISANAAVTGSVVVTIAASSGDSFQGALGVLTTVTTVSTLTNITNWGNIVDNAAFTDGTTRLMPGGYIYDEVAGTALSENDAAAARIDVKRAQIGVLEDATTRGQRASVSASGALKVDNSAVTQPISHSALTELESAINSNLVDVNIVSGAGSGGTAAADDADFTAGTTQGTPSMGVYESSPTSVTDGDLGTVGITSGRRLKTSATIDAALPAGTNNIGDVDVLSSALPSGASTSAKQDTIIGHLDGVEGLLTTIDGDTGTIATQQTDGTQKTQIVDAGGEAVTVTGGKLDVNATISGSSGGTSSIDDAAFTAASDSGTPMMGFASADTVDSGDVGVLAMDTARNLKVIAQSNSGVDIGDVTINNAAGASAVNIQDGGNAITVDNGGTFATQVDGAALTALQLIDDTVATLGTTTYTETTTKGNVIGAVRRDANTTLVDTTNEVAPLQVNATGELKVAQIQALPAGTNNIGDVDVASIAAGDNNIGNVDIVTVPADPFGANADAAATAGGTGSIQAKLRNLTSTNDSIKTAVETIDNAVSGAGFNVTQFAGTNNAVGSGNATGALRVELPTNGTGVIATVGAVTAISNALPAGTNAIGKLAANSGVDIGDVDVTSAVSATLDHGSNRDIDTSAEQITATSFTCKFGLTLKADVTNTGILYIGNSDVTAGTTAATDGIPLSAGESITIPVTNSNIPYAIASANNQIIYWVAV